MEGTPLLRLFLPRLGFTRYVMQRFRFNGIDREKRPMDAFPQWDSVQSDGLPGRQHQWVLAAGVATVPMPGAQVTKIARAGVGRGL